jgi:hypothetical protein
LSDQAEGLPQGEVDRYKCRTWWLVAQRRRSSGVRVTSRRICQGLHRVGPRIPVGFQGTSGERLRESQPVRYPYQRKEFLTLENSLLMIRV